MCCANARLDCLPVLMERLRLKAKLLVASALSVPVTGLGSDHAFAVTKGGAVKCWGSSQSGKRSKRAGVRLTAERRATQVPSRRSTWRFPDRAAAQFRRRHAKE
jgi:alpha-tubulin suppressor-like RCC1 family protein